MIIDIKDSYFWPFYILVVHKFVLTFNKIKTWLLISLSQLINNLLYQPNLDDNTHSASL